MLRRISFCSPRARLAAPSVTLARPGTGAVASPRDRPIRA